MDTAMEPNITNSLFTILNTFNHPVILVGEPACRWMGSAGWVSGGIELLLRDDQVDSIVAALIHSGHWTLLDAKMELEKHEKHEQRKKLGESQKLAGDEQYQQCEQGEESQKPDNDGKFMFDENILRYCHEADGILRLITGPKHYFSHLILWSEQTYRLKVDGTLRVQIPALLHGQSMVAENDFHPSSDRTDGWFFGPALLSQYDANRLLTVGEAQEGNLSIPSIPLYLDALVYHATLYSESKPSLAATADWQIQQLIQNLYLELPNRQIQILLQVNEDTEIFLVSRLRRYKRKPAYVVSKDKKVVQVERHRPESYPELLFPHGLHIDIEG